MKVCIGGTFDPLHDGHKALIKKAFEVAGSDGKVTIGLTSNSFASSRHSYKLLTYRQRKTNLSTILYQMDLNPHQFEIIELNDSWGPALTQDFDAIVVSPETLKSGLDLNRKRKELRLKPIKIIKIPFVKGEDGKPVSGTRINKKEIDKHGRPLLPKIL
jgi:pantetheine-phosphate adenylyltransferase